MQMLVVHHDAEVGEQLVQMVEDYTPHRCDHVRDEAAALSWARSHARCSLLIAQLEGPNSDGLALGGTLSEIFPGLQTMFLPGYQASEQRLEVAQTKIFPEPINGELLLNAIEGLAPGTPDTPDFFHALDVLQMCCLSKRSGAVQIVRGSESGIVFLKGGQIVDADTAGAHGIEALFEIGGWELVEFAYDGSVRGGQTISTPWDEALIEAVVRHREAKLRRTEAVVAPTLSLPEPEPPAPAPQKRSLFSGLRRTTRA